MSELNKINGKLEVKNGTATSTDVVQEWKDEDGNRVGHLDTNASLHLKKLYLSEDGSTGTYIGTPAIQFPTGYLNFPYLSSNQTFLNLSGDVNVFNLTADASTYYRIGLYIEGNKNGLAARTTANINERLIGFESNVMYIGNDTNASNRVSSINIIGESAYNQWIAQGASINLKPGNLNSSYFYSTEGEVRLYRTTKTEGKRDTINTITDNYITTKSDYCIEVDASSNAVEVELIKPDNKNNGQLYEIDVYDSTNTVTIIAYSKDLFDVDTITNTSGSTWRYTMNGSPDLSNIIIGDKIKVKNSTNNENDGYFITTAVNDVSDYIEVTNANGIVESSNSTSVIGETVFKDTTLTSGSMYLFRAYENRNTYKRITYQ